MKGFQKLICGAFLAVTAFPMLTAAADENPDAVFFAKAVRSGLSEINGGMLAQTMGNSSAVKDFGAMMVKDHTLANSKLRDLAESKSVDLPTAPGPRQSAKAGALKALSGDDFDKAYVEWQILSHRDAIAVFKEEIRSGDDVDVKQFADSTLPTLQAHLKALYAIPIPVAPPPAPAAPAQTAPTPAAPAPATSPPPAGPTSSSPPG